MTTAMERYGVSDLASRDPRELRKAALLIEAERLAAELRPLLNGLDCPVDVCLSIDQETAFICLWSHDGKVSGAPDWAQGMCLEIQTPVAVRLRDTLRNMPGRKGLERFYEQWKQAA